MANKKNNRLWIGTVASLWLLGAGFAGVLKGQSCFSSAYGTDTACHTTGGCGSQYVYCVHVNCSSNLNCPIIGGAASECLLFGCLSDYLFNVCNPCTPTQ